jgi:hypothetical protein
MLILQIRYLALKVKRVAQNFMLHNYFPKAFNAALSLGVCVAS